MSKEQYYELLRTAEVCHVTEQQLAEIYSLARTAENPQDFDFLRVVAMRFCKYVYEQLTKQNASHAKEKAQADS